MRRIIAVAMLIFILGGCAPKVAPVAPEHTPINIEDYEGIWYPGDVVGTEEDILIVSGSRCSSKHFEERELSGNIVDFFEDGKAIIFEDGKILYLPTAQSSVGYYYTRRYTEPEHEINQVAAEYARAMRDSDWDKVSSMSVVPLSEPDKDIFQEVEVTKVSLELRSAEEDAYCYDFKFEVKEPGRTVYRVGENERYLWVKDGKIELTTGLQ